MNKLDLLRFFNEYDGEVSEGDFTVDELQEALGEKMNITQKDVQNEYFEFYNDVKDRVRGHEDW